MKRLILFLLGALLMSACKKDIPNPALPDTGKFPVDAVTDFNLTSPANGLSINIKPGEQTVAFDWPDVTGATSYLWVADTVGSTDFSKPFISFPADSNGLKSALTLTYTQIYDALGTAGVAEGAKVNLIWSVKAVSAALTKLAETPHSISFQRGGVTFTAYVPANTPAGYDVYLAGEFHFLPGASDWQQPGTNPSLKMNKNADGSYSLILGVPKGTTLQYKFFVAPTGGSSWDHGETQPDGSGVTSAGLSNNRSFTYDGTNDENIQRVSFWQGYDYNYVVFNVATPAGTDPTKDVFVAGEWDKAGVAPGSWQQPGTNANLKMTNAGGGNYYFVIPQPASGTTFQYKYFLATTAVPDWNDGESIGDNRSFTYSGTNNSASDTVSGWSE